MSPLLLRNFHSSNKLRPVRIGGALADGRSHSLFATARIREPALRRSRQTFPVRKQSPGAAVKNRKRSRFATARIRGWGRVPPFATLHEPHDIFIRMIDSLAPARSVAPQLSAPPNSSRHFPSRSNLPHPCPLPKERENCPQFFSNVERLHRFMDLMRDLGIVEIPHEELLCETPRAEAFFTCGFVARRIQVHEGHGRSLLRATGQKFSQQQCP